MTQNYNVHSTHLVEFFFVARKVCIFTETETEVLRSLEAN